MTRSVSRIGRAAVLVFVVGCGACSPYLVRRDTLSDATGDAVEANIAKQVIDPWPVQASRIDRTTSGERAARAVERYRNPQTGPNVLGAGAPPGLPVAAATAPLGVR